MSISDTASPEVAPASLPTYTDTNGSSRVEHEDDTSRLQSHRFYLEDGNLRFQLEDGTLFNVHRHFFKKHAPSFAVEYLQDVAEEPIRLPGITTIDFERFFTMIYPSEIGERDIETIDEWTSVLRLATKWAVPRLRTLAICEIEPKATPIEKVDTAREFDLGKDWLLPSFTTICTSSKPLDYEEAERLGLRTVVDIARIREARCRSRRSVVDVSPSGDHDPVIDDLSPTPLSESSTTDIPSSPAGPEDVPSDGDATQGPHAHDTHPTGAESPSHLDAVTSGHFTDESVMPESLLERALLALKLEKEGETEQPVSLDDGAFYKIHRYLFHQYCPQFVAQYLQDSSEQIIVLRDLASHDFQRFLSMVYPSEIGGCDIRSVDEWTSILRIATRLSIPSLCARAIREIESTATPIDKVTIAREFNLGDSWFLPAFTAICEADQWLKYEEAERLGLRTVVEIGRIREEQRSARDFAGAVRASPVLMSSDCIMCPTLSSVDKSPHQSVTKLQEILATKLSDAHQSHLPALVCAEDIPVERASSILSNDISAIQIGVTDISNRLAHFALQYSEMAEAANVRGYYYPTTYALELAHRIETETSPAAKLQLEWRRKRVEKFIHDTFYCHSDAANDLDASVFIWKGTIGSYLGDPLAMIAARQLVRRGHCACGTFDAELGHSTQRSTLVIRNLRQAPVKKLVESELKKFGFIVSNVEESATASFASADTISIAFTSTPGSPVSNSAAPHGEHEETDVAAQAHWFYLEDGNLKIQLDEGTFYNVHRHFFERHAPRFAEKYLRGEQPDLIQHHGVSSVDFQRFLSIIYPSDLGICDICTVDEWTSVLRLASQWSVPRLRDVAIREIGALSPTPIERVVIAREFGLGPTWLVPAFIALCRTSEPLGYEDAERLSLRTVVEIARINREELHARGPYDVEAAVRASDVLLPPRANGVRTPAVSHDSGRASKLDRAHDNSSESLSTSDTHDNMVYMAMLAEEKKSLL
ncbi:hypothetical protein K523DRAFT_347156 [Schizophyllum commune Tattone D]|nr:hypothetical protein K523DRAFT_347156 [Schizophyllum commune Tattone D]